MPQYIGAVPIPPVSEEFVKSLVASFPRYEIKPGFDRDEAMQSCGEQKVIEWIIHHSLRGRTVTGEPAALRNTIPTGAIVKLGS